MKALRLLLALTLAWLLCASKSRADEFGNRAWGKSAYQSVITPDDEWQTLVRYQETPTGYDESASGQEVWTKFDPDGRQTMDPVSPGNLLPALTVIALTGIVVDIGYHDVKNYLHPSSPAPSSDQSPAPAAAAPTKQPAAAQPSAAPPPPNGEGDDGDKSLNKNKSGGNNPEGSAKGDADKAADKAADTKAARQKGIRDMWKQEAENIKNGKPSRDWTPQQQKDILEGRVPKSVVDGKPIEGAHIEPVKDAPEKAADPNNIKPKSFTEHRAADGGEHSSNPKPYDTGPTTTP